MFQLVIKDFYKFLLLESPDNFQHATSIFMLPWSFKFFYAMISDSFPIIGYKRKFYIAMNGFINFFCILLLFSDAFYSYFWATLLISISMITSASTDILVDALMATESKKDLKRGSEDLTTLANSVQGVVGCVAAIVGAFVT